MRRLSYYLFVMCFASGLFFPSFVVAQEPQATMTNYMVFFQLTEYNSKVADSVDYLFEKVVKAGDGLTVFSPQRPYSFSPQTFKSQPLKELVKRTKDVLKRDISVTAGDYREIEDTMTQIVLDIAEATGTSSEGSSGFASGGGNATQSLKSLIVQYRQLLENLRGLRKLNEDLFMKMATMFKGKGKTNVYIIYESIFRVIPDRDTMDALRRNQDVAFDATEVFTKVEDKEFMDTAKVISALKDAGITVHFIYMKREMRKRPGTEINEFSSDVYNVLSKVAKGTGGVIETTSKPSSVMKKIAGK